MVKSKMTNRLLAVLASIAILVGLLPVNWISAGSTDAFGTLSLLTADGAVTGTPVSGEEAEMQFTDKALEWVPNEGIRPQDGWWVGVRVTAPDSINSDNLKNVQYKRVKNGTPVGEWIAFESAQTPDTNTADYWCLVNEEKLNDALLAGDKYVTYSWQYDWDGNGVDDDPNDQLFTLNIEVEDLVLNKGEEQVYPAASGAVSALTADLSVSGDGNENLVYATFEKNVSLEWEAADESIDRMNDGWWAGIRVTAPEDAALNEGKVSYQRKTATGWSDRTWSDGAEGDHIDLWCLLNEEKLVKDNADYIWRFDWDGDGTYEQIVALQMDPAKIILKKGEEQVYPQMGSAAMLNANGIVVGEFSTGTAAVVSFAEMEFEWVAAEDIRPQDGWWAGMRIYAPAYMQDEDGLKKVTYTRKGVTTTYEQSKNDWHSDAKGYYIDMWCLLNESILNSARNNNKQVTYTWEFDWHGDASNKQTVTLSVDPATVKLMKNGEEQMYPQQGSAVKLDADGNTYGDSQVGKEAVVLYEDVTFNWVAADTNIQREYDGWWAGMRIYAPAYMQDGNREKIAVKRKGATENEIVEWKKDANGYYIDQWCLITPEYLENALSKEKNLSYTWQFDWYGDGVYEQDITLSVNPANTVLVKGENELQMYPAQGSAIHLNAEGKTDEGTLQTGKETVVSFTGKTFNWVAKDESIERPQDGWWAGMRVYAPAYVEEADLEKISFTRKGVTTNFSKDDWKKDDNGYYIDQWCLITPEYLKAALDGEKNLNYTWEIDWNGNGLADQKVTLSVDPATTTLLYNGVASYPYATFEHITDKDVTETGCSAVPTDVVYKSGEEAGYYTTIEVKNLKLDWVEADTSIGRNQRGWWAGLRVTAVGAANGNAIKYQRKTADTWGEVRSWSDGAEGDHIDFWCLLNQEKLDNNNATYTYRFDLNGDEVYDQYITFKIDPETCTLKKKECTDFAFADNTPNKVWIGSKSFTVTAASKEQLAHNNGVAVEYHITKKPKDWDNITIDNNGVITFGKYDGYVAEDGEIAEITVSAKIQGDEFYKAKKTEFIFTAYKEPFVAFAKKNVDVTYGENGNVFCNELILNGLVKEEDITFEVIKGDSVSVDATTGELKIQKSGTATIRAKFDSSYYLPYVEYTITVNRAQQELSFEKDKVEKYYGITSYDLYEENKLSFIEDENAKGEITYEITNLDADKDGKNLNASIVDGKIIIDDPIDETYDKDGSITITATYVEDDCYKGCSLSYTLDIAYLTGTPNVTLSDANGNHWFSGDVTIYAPAGYQISFSNDLSNNVWDDTVTYSAEKNEGKTTPTVYLKNADGAITDAIVVKYTAEDKPDDKVYIDIADPKNLRIEYSDEVKAVGTTYYYKDSVTLTLFAEDALSGIDYFLYSEDGVTYKEAKPIRANETTGNYVLEITSLYNGKVWIKAVDKAGNTSILESDRTLVVDEVAPIVTVGYNKEFVDSVDKDTWETDENATLNTVYIYKEDVTVTITVKEDNFVGEDVAISIDGKRKPVEEIEWKEVESAQNTHATELTLGEGQHTLEIEYADRSGNEMQSTDKYPKQNDGRYISYRTVDTTAPVMSVEYDNNAVKKTVGDRDYFEADRTATVTIKEANFRPNEVALTVKAVDVTGKTVKYTCPDLTDWSAWKEDKKNPGTWTAKIPFTVEANYTVTLDYIDLAKNEAVDENGARPETGALYQKKFTVDKTEPQNLQVTYTQPIVEQLLGKFTFGFYKERVKVTLSAEDNITNIDEFVYSYLKQNNVSDVNAELKDQVIKTTRKGNRFEASFYISKEALRADNQFRGNVSFTATDRAMNSATYKDGTVVVVDNIAPTLSVSYEAKSEKTTVNYTNADKKNVDTFAKATQAYYNGNVNATITVNEANFFEGTAIKDENGKQTGVVHKIGILLTKVDNEGNTTRIEYLPKGSASMFKDVDKTADIQWTTKGDIHTFTIPYTTDADYTLSIEYVDHSGNSAEITANDGKEKTKKYTSKTVTVDKTAPVIEVEYNDLDAVKTKNGRKYYDDTRIATITVTEHNFRASDILWSIQALDVAGAEVKNTYSIGKWSHSGDVHTISITFKGDANYTFGADYTDLALKKAKSYGATPFTVDKTAPTNLKVEYGESVNKDWLSLLNGLFNFYEEQMTVTISATDRTSEVDELVYSYLKEEGVSGVNAELKNGTAKTKRDGYTFVATFTIPKDKLNGANQFRGYVEFSATNRSGWISEKTDDKHTVVVDSLAPVGAIEIAGNKIPGNDGKTYIHNDATVNLTVNEANFFASDVKVTLTRKAHPAVAAVNYTIPRYTWTAGEGDKHHTSFTLTEDGEYEVTLNYTDKAGNVMNTEKASFVIDNTVPEISVTGVKHQSANNAETITLTVTVSDANLKRENVNLTLLGMFKDDNNVIGAFTNESFDDISENVVDNKTVITYTINNIDKDGYYKLSGIATDLSGNRKSLLNVEGVNEPQEMTTFSVNRNGSAFFVTSSYNEEKAKDGENLIKDKYVNGEVSIVLHEINVDGRDPSNDTVLLINDGNSSRQIELVKGDTLIETKPDENTGWYQYKYVLADKYFENDGEYSITLLTYDEAGNSNLNTKPDKDGKTEGVVTFVLDRTKPLISANIRNNQAVDATEHWVTFDITERNLKKDTVKAKVNGEEVELTDLGNNEYKFLLSSGTYATIEIMAEDEAGNESAEYKIENFRVTTNWLALRWNEIVYGGKWVVVVGVIGALAAVLVVVLLLIKRKKNKTKE